MLRGGAPVLRLGRTEVACAEGGQASRVCAARLRRGLAGGHLLEGGLRGQRPGGHPVRPGRAFARGNAGAGPVAPLRRGRRGQLVGGAVVASCWTENYGDASDKKGFAEQLQNGARAIARGAPVAPPGQPDQGAPPPACLACAPGRLAGQPGASSAAQATAPLHLPCWTRSGSRC